MFFGGALAMMLSACASSEPSRPRRVREVASETGGEIVGVRDVMIDPSAGPEMKVGVPVSSPLGILRVPVTVPGGGSKREIPGEELAVRLDEGRTILIVQERASPPFAIGERVRVLHERENLVTGIAKTRIEREE
jgi:outer membrane lipoprotein SlyB